VIPYTTSLEDIKAKNPKGIIFTGGPNSVYKEDSPSYDKSIFEITDRQNQEPTLIRCSLFSSFLLRNHFLINRNF